MTTPVRHGRSRVASVRLFILSDVITQFGAGMVLSASAWYVFDESRSNTLVAVTASVNTVSGMLVSLVAGTIVDRFRPKSVALGSHLLRVALIAGPLALFASFGFHPAFAFLLALNNGIGWNVYFPASKSIIQRLANGDGTVRVNSAAEVSMQVGLFSSGAVAGFFYRSVGFAPILIASLLAFVIGIVVLAAVTVPAAAATAEHHDESFVHSFRSGFGYLRQHPRVLTLALVLYSPFVVANIFATVLPGYVSIDLHSTSVGYGMVDMVWGAGACLAGILTMRMTRRAGAPVVVATGLATLGAYGLAMTANSSIAMAVGLTTIAGFSAAATRIVLYSEIMAAVPPVYLGRVIALANVASLLLQTVLAQSAGVLMDLTAPRYGFLLVGLVCVLAVIAYRWLGRGSGPAAEQPPAGLPIVEPARAHLRDGPLRIAFLRSVDIRQAHPSLPEAVSELRATGHEVVVFLVDDVPDGDVGLDGIIHLPASSTVEQIAAALSAWRPDRVVSISIPDDKALRDSSVRALLQDDHGLDFVIHPLGTTHALSNKWETRRLVQELGLAVAPGFLISGDLLRRRGVAYDSYRDYVGLQLGSLTYPVITKPVWDSMAQGIRTFSAQADIERWLAESPPEVDVLVEEYLAGELFGIEVVGRDGRYWCQPLVRKCLAHGDDLVPFNHIRFGPVTDDRYDLAGLQVALRIVALALDLCGSAEFELMWWDERFHVIEVNPRVSGMTNLSIAISGINTYAVLATDSTVVRRADQFTAEVPLVPLVSAQHRALSDAPGVRTVQTVTYHDGTVQSKMLLTAETADDALERLRAIDDAQHVIAPAVLEELSQALGRPSRAAVVR